MVIQCHEFEPSHVMFFVSCPSWLFQVEKQIKLKKNKKKTVHIQTGKATTNKVILYMSNSLYKYKKYQTQ